MDEVHKVRINSNIRSLVENTIYKALVHSFERMDKTNTIPETLLRKWKERPELGYSTKQLNMLLYEEIQRRGPEAFNLLLVCLKESGHHTLACLLDPTLREVGTSEAESAHQEEVYYDNDGLHLVYVDHSWEREQCNADRKALQNLFVNQGYQVTQEFPTEGVASFVVLNFSSLDTSNSGGIMREKDWVHRTFMNPIFDGKPKILISLRYNRKKEESRSSVEHDTALVKKLYRDLLWVKIYLKDIETKPEDVSEEVKCLIQVFSVYHPVNFRDKLLRLQGEFEKQKLKPLIIQDSGFSKLFKLKKRT